MKKRLAILAASAALATGMMAAPAMAEKPSCNWGELTASAIADGFAQGEHSSSFAGAPRVGLANVINKGDLNATCEFIAGTL